VVIGVRWWVNRYKGLRVFFDLDDTLLNLQKAIIPFNNEFFGIEITPDQYNGNWKETWGKEFRTQAEFDIFIKEEWWPAVIKAHLYENIQAMPGARSLLRWLQKRGVLIYAITSRPERIRDVTKELLGREFSGVTFQEIIFLGNNGHSTEKGAVVRQYRGVILVDDVKYQIDSAIEKGILGLLFGGTPDKAGVGANESNGLYRVTDWGKAKSVLRRMLKAVAQW